MARPARPHCTARSRWPEALLLGLALVLHAAGARAFAHDAKVPSDDRANRSITPAPVLSHIKPAADFTLRDTAGRPLRLSELRGRVVLMSFVYTTCTTACPLLTARMAALQARLGRVPTSQASVRFLSVTVDPARDSAETLSRYASRFRADLRTWGFLREEPEALGPVLASYDEWTRRMPDGEVDHPARVYLIDPRGDIREIYALGFFDERQAWLDIMALLAEANGAGAPVPAGKELR